MSEAIKAGVTIPLNLMHFPELSEFMRAKISEFKTSIPENHNEWIDVALEWQGNQDGLGSVSLIVLSSKRRGRIGKGFHTEVFPENPTVTDPGYAGITGRTLRELLEIGFVYSSGSSHGTNLYDEGLVLCRRTILTLLRFGAFAGRTANHVPVGGIRNGYECSCRAGKGMSCLSAT